LPGDVVDVDARHVIPPRRSGVGLHGTGWVDSQAGSISTASTGHDPDVCATSGGKAVRIRAVVYV
jgi:hypothetical protein